MANKHTVNKTKCHLKVLKHFLDIKDEHMDIENIPSAELDLTGSILSGYSVCVFR